jgi:hypothetical protein
MWVKLGRLELADVGDVPLDIGTARYLCGHVLAYQAGLGVEGSLVERGGQKANRMVSAYQLIDVRVVSGNVVRLGTIQPMSTRQDMS